MSEFLEVYLRQDGGSDSNDGLTYDTAFQTLDSATDFIYENIASQNGSVHLKIYKGRYRQLVKTNSINPIISGTMVYEGMDFDVVIEGSQIVGSKWQASSNSYGFQYFVPRTCTIKNIHFYHGEAEDGTPWTGQTAIYGLYDSNSTPHEIPVGYGVNQIRIINCTFHGPSISNTYASICYESASFHNCTIKGYYINNEYLAEFHNCIVIPHYHANFTEGMKFFNCASDLPAIYSQSGCFNIADSGKELPMDLPGVYEPKIVMDSTKPSFEFYMTAGENGGPVGAIYPLALMDAQAGSDYNTKAGFWNKDLEYDMFSGGTDTIGNQGWKADEAYFSTAASPIEIEAGTNDNIRFTDNGTIYNAIIPPAIYSDKTVLTDAISLAMNTEGSGSIAFSSEISADGKLHIIGDDVFILNCLNSPVNSAYSALKFDVSSDKSGLPIYSSKAPALMLGPSVSAKDNATFPIVSQVNGGISPQWAAVDGSTHCRIVSQVLEFKTLLHVSRVLLSFEAINGGTIDTDPASPGNSIQVRGSSGSFGEMDSAGSTSLDWIDIDINSASGMPADNLPYWQFAIEIRR